MRFPSLMTGKKDGPKVRAFTLRYVASIQAPGICPPAGNGTLRPVLFAYAGTSSAVRAFTRPAGGAIPHPLDA